MPDIAAPETTEETAPAEGFGALENRLNAEQIAQLDEMNASVFRDAPTEPAPDAPAAAPAPKAPVAPAALDEFTPPDDDMPPGDTPPVAPDGKTTEFPEGKDLFPDDAIEKLRTEKSKGDIRGLREHYETAIKTVKELQGKIDARSTNGAADKETLALVEDLKARNAQLNAIVEQKAIQDHPWFQQNFIEPRKQAMAAAEKALDLAGIDDAREALEKAMGLEGRERIAALDQLFESVDSSMLKARLENAVASIEAIDEKKTSFLADREGNTAKMMAEQRASQHQALQQQETFVKDGIERTLQHLAGKSPFFRKSGKPGYEKWDAAMDEDRAVMEDMALRNEDPLKLISTITLGVRAGRILAAYDKVKTALAAERQKNADLLGSRPQLNGDRVENGQHQQPTVDPNEDLVAASRRVMGEIGSGY